MALVGQVVSEKKIFEIVDGRTDDGRTDAGSWPSYKPNGSGELTKSMDHEIKVKVSGSRCVLEEYVKHNYYARFEARSYH